MPGLLDILNNLTSEQNRGLMSAGASVLQRAESGRPFSLGHAMGLGGESFFSSMDQQRARKLAEQEAAQLAEMRGFAIKDKQSDYEAQELQRQRARELDVLRNSYRPRGRQSAPPVDRSASAVMQGLMDGDLPQMDAPGAPVAGGMPAGGQSGGGGIDLAALAQEHLDYAQFLRDNGKHEAAQAEIDKALKMMPEFDTTPRTGNDASGKPFQYLVGKRGEKRILENTLPREELKLMNLGGKEQAYNPFELKSGQTFQRTMTPGEAAGNALGWANHGLSKERLSIERAEAATRAAIGKAPTEFQGKSAAFGLRATEADKIISELTGQYNPAAVNSKTTVENWPLIGGALGAATNTFALNANDQKAEQAQRDFVNAVLRQESGAAIGPDEFNNARKQYFPQPGDGPDVIAQKARNRQLAIQGFQSNAGRAAMTAPPRAAASSGWSIQRVD